MKSFFVVALLVAVVAASPITPDGGAQIVRYESDNIGVDGFNYAYETSNKISAAENGQLRDAGTENEGIEVSGQFSYLGDDGKTYLVSYTAGRNGFQPIGEHLPVGPSA